MLPSYLCQISLQLRLFLCQVPRLTAMLRAFATGSGRSGALDVSALYVQRAQALEAKRKDLANNKVMAVFYLIG